MQQQQAPCILGSLGQHYAVTSELRALSHLGPIIHQGSERVWRDGQAQEYVSPSPAATGHEVTQIAGQDI